MLARAGTRLVNPYQLADEAGVLDPETFWHLKSACRRTRFQLWRGRRWRITDADGHTVAAHTPHTKGSRS